MAKPTRREFFRCPKCNALYQLVRGKAGPETTSGGETACQVCGELLATSEGAFVLKYLLLRQAVRRKVWQKRTPAQ